MVETKLNIKELKDYLKHFVKNNQYIQKKGMHPIAVNVEGEAGIGKTSAIEQLAAELELDLVKLNLAQIEELGDLVGFPIRQFQMAKNKGTKENPEWAMKWVNEQLVETYKDRGLLATGKSQMSYCAPEWIEGKKEGGVLLLDDYSRADSRFQQACMELIQKQEYISWKLPKNWHIFLSTNPDNGEYFVQAMDPAQRTRMVNTSIQFDVDCWAEWAESAGMDGRCINFLLMHPEVIQGDINSRCASTFFNSISSFSDFESNLPMIQLIGEGSVGGEFSTMFTTFINNNLDKLVTPKRMLLESNEETIAEELSDALHVDGSYRADIASVLSTRLANYTINYASKNPITPSINERVIMLTTDDNIFTDDLRYTIASQLVASNKQKWSKYMMNPKVMAMITR